MNVKRFSLLGVVLVSGVLFAACSSPGQTAPATTSGSPAVQEKSGDTSKTGVITDANGSYFLTVPGEAPLEIDSYSVELGSYVGQTVTVTGQYSGDTLFVGKLE